MMWIELEVKPPGSKKYTILYRRGGVFYRNVAKQEWFEMMEWDRSMWNIGSNPVTPASQGEFVLLHALPSEGTRQVLHILLEIDQAFHLHCKGELVRMVKAGAKIRRNWKYILEQYPMVQRMICHENLKST